MLPETEIQLCSIADPQLKYQGRLRSLEGRYAEVALDEETALSRGSLVQFQTADTLYLAEIESGWIEDGNPRLRALIEHAVDLKRAAEIRRLWNTGSSTP